MALVATPSELSPVQVTEIFSETIVFSDDESIEGGNTGNVLSVTSSFKSSSINLSFSNTSNTLIISGFYSADIFDQNFVRYFTRGKSDLLETPKQVSNIFSLDPLTDQVYQFSPDPRSSIDIIYTVETDLGTVQLTKNVLNNYNTARDVLRNYI